MERWIRLTDQLNAWHTMIKPVEFASIVNKDLLNYYSFTGSNKENCFKQFDEMKQFCVALTLSFVCAFRQYPQIIQDFYDENDESIDKILNMASDYISGHSQDHRNFITTVYDKGNFEADMARVFAWARASYLRFDEVRSVENIVLGNTVENARILELERQLEDALQNNSTEKALSTRERNSYLKVIAASICRKGDPSALEERGLAGKLGGWAQSIGVSLSDDTAKKIINQAIDLLR